MVVFMVKVSLQEINVSQCNVLYSDGNACVRVCVCAQHNMFPTLKGILFFGWFHLLSDVTIHSPFNLSTSLSLFHFHSLSLFKPTPLTPWLSRLITAKLS